MGEDKDFLNLIEDFDKKCHMPDNRIENIRRSRMSYIDTWQRYNDLYNRYSDIVCKYSSGKIGENGLYEELDDIYMSLYRLLKNYSSYEFSFSESTHQIVIYDDHATSIKDIQFNSLETKISELTDRIYHRFYEKDGTGDYRRYRRNSGDDFYAFFDDYVNPEVPIANGGCNSHTTCRIIKIGDKADLNHAPEWFFDTPTYTGRKSRMDHIPDQSVVVSKQYIQLRCPVCGKPMSYDVSAEGTNFRANRMQRSNIGSPVHKIGGYPEYRCVNCHSIITYGYRDVQPAYKEPTPFYEEGDREITTQIRARFFLTDNSENHDDKNSKSFLSLRKILWWIKAFLFCGPFGIFRHMTDMQDEFGLDFISFLLFLLSTACILTSVMYPHTNGSSNVFLAGLILLFILLIITTTVFVATKEKWNEEYKEKFDGLTNNRIGPKIAWWIKAFLGMGILRFTPDVFKTDHNGGLSKLFFLVGVFMLFAGFLLETTGTIVQAAAGFVIGIAVIINITTFSIHFSELKSIYKKELTKRWLK